MANYFKKIIIYIIDSVLQEENISLIIIMRFKKYIVGIYNVKPYYVLNAFRIQNSSVAE